MAITITSTNTPGKTFASGETVTPAKLNSLGAPTTATGVTLGTDKLLGRVSADTGAVEEVPCTDFAQSLLDDANAAAARSTLGLGTVSTQAAANMGVAFDVCHINNSTLTYAGTTAIDLSTSAYTCQTVSLTGNVTFTTSNKAASRTKMLRVICDATPRTFTFPSWVWVGGSAPTGIAASKTAVITLVCFGTADTDIIASYVVQL